MQYLGFFLLAVAVVLVIVGFMQRAKMKRILAAPFKKTGEIASNPQAGDAEGLVSTEGRIVAPQPILAPCSGKPCLYYEIKAERKWEKTVATEDGHKTQSGSSTISTTENGSVFQVDDGSGPIGVDAREKVDCDLTKSFEQTQGAWGDVYFGQYHVHVPHSSGEEYTKGVTVTEKIIPAEGALFVLGKLAGGTITKRDGMLGKIMMSTKGRDSLIGSTKRNMILGFVFGGLSLGGGVPLSIFADAPEAAKPCEFKDASVCNNQRVYEPKGQDHTWTVSKGGSYKITVNATGKSLAMRLWPKITLKDSKGSVLGSEKGDSTGIEVLACVAKGTYKFNITDMDPGHLNKIKGGAGYNVTIEPNKDPDCKPKGGDDDDKKKGDDDGDKKKADDDDDKKDDDKKADPKKKK